MEKTMLNKLENIAIDWADKKGIFIKATPMTQMRKTLEEVEELNRAVIENNKIEIKDGIGDVLVTLVIQAKMHGFDLQECLEYVLYNNDSPLLKRTGKMVDGLFVKDKTTER
jgi:NTP pyrophosphatase (non-canonical NTP hydrolase)